LSGQAFVDEATANARSTPERIKALREMLDTDCSGFPGCLTFLARATRADVANLTSATVPEPPRTAGNSLVGRWSRDLPTLSGELASRGYNIMELIAVGCLQAGEAKPQAFGTFSSIVARDAYLEAVKTRLESLLSLLATSYTPADLEDTVESKGSPPVTTFAVTHGQVSVAPKFDMPERLARWASQQEDLIHA
jgi:hypothetical protein